MAQCMKPNSSRTGPLFPCRAAEPSLLLTAQPCKTPDGDHQHHLQHLLGWVAPAKLFLGSPGSSVPSKRGSRPSPCPSSLLLWPLPVLAPSYTFPAGCDQVKALSLLEVFFLVPQRAVLFGTFSTHFLPV